MLQGAHSVPNSSANLPRGEGSHHTRPTDKPGASGSAKTDAPQGWHEASKHHTVRELVSPDLSEIIANPRSMLENVSTCRSVWERAMGLSQQVAGFLILILESREKGGDGLLILGRH